jgi:16S rRNA (cytidine1402-2'-O)-methyltransferase
VLGNRNAALARELTKLHEDIRRGDLMSLAALPDQISKGEFVIVVGPALDHAASDDAINAALNVALKSMSLKDAAKAIADRLRVPKARVYDLGLQLKSGENG